jgi:hypothetical protein
MRRIFTRFLFIAILAAGFAGCAQKTPLPVASTQTPGAADLPGYPTYAAQAGDGNAAYPAEGQSQIPTPIRYKAGEVPPSPADAPQPESGKASISGTLFSYTTLSTLPDLQYFLTPAQGDKKDTPPPFSTGPNVEKGDIVGQSDEQGQFTLANVPPGNYFMIIWSPVGWPIAVESPTSETSRLIELKADQKNPLGVVYFSWP